MARYRIVQEWQRGLGIVYSVEIKDGWWTGWSYLSGSLTKHKENAEKAIEIHKNRVVYDSGKD